MRMRMVVLQEKVLDEEGLTEGIGEVVLQEKVLVKEGHMEGAGERGVGEEIGSDSLEVFIFGYCVTPRS